MNQLEERFCRALQRAGYTVLRQGWPDFLVIDRDGVRAYALEVKADGDDLSREQTAMHDALRRLGLTVAIVRGPDLLEIEARKGRLLLTSSDASVARARLVRAIEDLEQTLAMGKELLEQVEAMPVLLQTPNNHPNSNGANGRKSLLPLQGSNLDSPDPEAGKYPDRLG